MSIISISRACRAITTVIRISVLLVSATYLVSAATITFTDTSDWGSGMDGEITIDNAGGAAIKDWNLQFDLPGSISSIWDATVDSHVGNTYVVSGAAWDSTIPANGQLSFGFAASPGHIVANDFVLGPNASNPGSGDSNPGSGVAFTFTDTSDWGTGMNGQITIANNGNSIIQGWELQFDFPGAISSIWDATLESHVGNAYTVRGVAWENVIPVGGEVSFGFTASPGGKVATDFVLRSQVASVASVPEPSFGLMTGLLALFAAWLFQRTKVNRAYCKN